MSIRLPVATRNTIADAVADLVDAGSGAGILRVYSGSQPASADLPFTGTLLATFILNDPAFAAASAGSAALIVSPALSTTGVGAGDAGWCRLLTSAGATIMDGSVSAAGGGGNMIMSTVTISIGLTLTLTAGTITMPAA